MGASVLKTVEIKEQVDRANTETLLVGSAIRFRASQPLLSSSGCYYPIQKSKMWLCTSSWTLAKVSELRTNEANEEDNTDWLFLLGLWRPVTGTGWITSTFSWCLSNGMTEKKTGTSFFLCLGQRHCSNTTDRLNEWMNECSVHLKMDCGVVGWIFWSRAWSWGGRTNENVVVRLTKRH